MNKVVLMGRLTKDPEVRYSQSDSPVAVARYTLACDRRFKRDGEPSADFIPCVSFGKQGEVVEKYFRKGMRVAVSGRIQTRSSENGEGRRVYVTEVVVEEQEFAESKSSSDDYRREQSRSNGGFSMGSDPGDGFMNIPDGIDEELPFN